MNIVILMAENLRDVHRQLIDEEGLSFWFRRIGTQVYDITIPEFIQHLSDEFSVNYFKPQVN